MIQYSRRHNSDDQDDDDYDDHYQKTQDHIDDLREHIIKTSTKKKRKRATPRLDPKYVAENEEVDRCLQTHEWCQLELEIIRTYYYEMESKEDCIKNCYNHIIIDNKTVGMYTSPKQHFFYFHYKNLKKFSKGFFTMQQPEDFRRELLDNNIIEELNEKHVEKSQKKLFISRESDNVHVKQANKLINYSPSVYSDQNNYNYDCNYHINDDDYIIKNADADNENFTQRFINQTVVNPTKLSSQHPYQEPNQIINPIESEFSCINVTKSSYNGFFLTNNNEEKAFYLQSDCLAIESNTWCGMKTSELSKHNLKNMFLIDYSRNFEESFANKPITFIILGLLHLRESKDKPFLLLYVPQYNISFTECVYRSNHESIKRKFTNRKNTSTSVSIYDDTTYDKIEIIDSPNQCVYMNWNGRGFDATRINLESKVACRSQQTGEEKFKFHYQSSIAKNKWIIEIPNSELNLISLSTAQSGSNKNAKKNGKLRNCAHINMEIVTYSQNKHVIHDIYRARRAAEIHIAKDLHPGKLIGNHKISIKSLIDYLSNEIKDSDVRGKVMSKLLEDLRWTFNSDDFRPLNDDTFSIASQSYDIDSVSHSCFLLFVL